MFDDENEKTTHTALNIHNILLDFCFVNSVFLLIAKRQTLCNPYTPDGKQFFFRVLTR